MPRKNQGKKKKGQNPSGGKMVNISGPGGFRLDFPIPRLPRWLGTPNLRANNSVYPRVDLDVPIAVDGVAIVSGALAQVISVDTTLINSWATRFQSLFQEFAIVGARFEIRITTVTSGQGMILAYIDENSATAPTSTQALARPHAEIPVTSTTIDSAGSMHVVEWRAHSYADLTWDPVSATGIVAYLKLFASVAFTGTSASTAAQITVTGAYAVSFRGYA